jgi:hypothetical protein
VPQRFFRLLRCSVSACMSLADYYKARLIALRVVELWKYPFADYAAYEADYAKFFTVLNEGGQVQLQRFVKQYSLGGPQPELGVHNQIEIDVPLQFEEQNQAWYGGIGDTTMGFKREMWSSLRSGSIFSLFGGVIVPTGSRSRGFG